MLRTLYLLAFLTAVYVIYALTQLGTAYVEVGHGLHPALAVLGVCAVTVLGWSCVVRLIRG